MYFRAKCNKKLGRYNEVELEPNQKLVEVTWKNDSLWFLTKNMQEDDVAESYKFYEKDTLGLLEGSVHITETKLEKEELEEYNLQKQLEEDYYKEGNFVQSEGQTEPEVVFIKYDEVNDKYIKVKDYKYDSETGALISK